MSRFDELPKDVLIETVVKFNLDDVYQFCHAYPQHKNVICNNNLFWRRKLLHDYNINYIGKYPEYRYLYNNMDDWKILQKGIEESDLDLIDYAYSLGTLRPMDINRSVRHSLDKPLILKHLIDLGADVNSDHGAPLIGAAQMGNLETVKILIENGADVHSRGDLALATAIYGNHIDTVKYLVEQGADYNLPLYQNYLSNNDSSGYIRFIRNNPNIIERRNIIKANEEFNRDLNYISSKEKILKEVTPLNKDITRKILYTEYKENLCSKLDRKSLYVLYNFAYLLGIELNRTESREDICKKITKVL